MKLLVIIVTYNAMQWAERCFSSLKNSTVSPDIFVVDNGSTDGTPAFINEHFPEVMFHQSEENLGFGKANNLGLQYALDYNYDYVYLLNQDAWVQNDTFERLVEISKKYPEYGILSPFQMNADMQHIDRNFVANVLAWKSNPDIVDDMYRQQLKEVYPVNGVMAAHWFMPIKTVKRVGGFSPSFPHYGEDNNYVVRLLYRHMKVGVVPRLRVVHDRGWRKETIKKSIFLAYTSSIEALSNTQIGFVRGLCIIISTCLFTMVKYKSIYPFMNLMKIFFHYFEIINNKRISMNKDGAFLYL